MLSAAGLPRLSRAGVNLARICIRRQVVESRLAEPLDRVTVQLVTRPFEPTSSRKPTAPSSPFSTASAG
jgi:hypothetical protein